MVSTFADSRHHPLRRSLGLLAGRPLLRLTAAVGIAVVAAGSSIGLLGLSGWFVTSCALVGSAPGGNFNYYTPSGGVRGFALSRIASRYVERLTTHGASLDWLIRLRLRLFDDAATLPPARLRTFAKGDLLDRAVHDTDTLDLLLAGTVVPVAVAMIGGAGGVLALAMVCPPAALACAVGFLVTAVLGIGAVAVSRARVQKVARARGAARAHLVDGSAGAAEFACLGATGQISAMITGHLDELRHSRRHAEVTTSLWQTLAGVSAAATLLAVLVAAVTARPTLDPALATLVVLIAAGVVELLDPLSGAAREAVAATAAAARLNALASPAPAMASVPAGEGGLAVRVTGVDAAAAARQILHGVDLMLAAGSVTVISGPSGAGKTTLLRVLAGEITPTTGTVRLDGQPPDRYPPRAVVLVAADDLVFSGTIGENLRLGDPALTDEKIIELLEAFALAGPRGLTPATPLGPTGRTLSGGEQRRLCVARAVAAKPRLLLLDEPTEGVDVAQARQALTALTRLLPNTTVVVAVHDRNHDHLPWPDLTHVQLAPDGTISSDESESEYVERI